MGGDNGTSWSFEDYMAYLENAGSTEASSAASEAMGKIRQYNVRFAVSMGLSLVIASSAATILIQQLAHSYQLRRNRP